jgi:phasin family protein
MSDRFGIRPDEMMKLFSEFRMPQFGDMEGFAQAQRRNLEALSAANRIALEGAQAVARRHMEIMQSAMAEMTDAMRTMSGTETPQERAARQAEMLKAGYERAVSNMKEIADLIQKSNAEALTMLNRRFTEAMDEIKQIASKAGQS